MIRYREISNFSFSPIFRVFISGCSASGKTHFAHELLQSNLIQYDRVYYYHPDFHEQAPVTWHESLEKPVLYHPGIPSLEELLEIPEKSVLVFDDLMSQCCESKQIDYLFRVLSSKRKLNVIIMTQRYFSNGKCGLSIRNSSNYHVLLRNADARTNLLVANAMQLKPEITRAQTENKARLYPYIFIDRTNEARVKNLQIFTDIFSCHKEVIIGSMKYFLISESDFNQQYHCVGDNLARHNGINKTTPVQQRKNDREEYPEKECSGIESKANTTLSKRDFTSKFKQRRQLQRQIERALRRHKINAKLQCKN